MGLFLLGLTACLDSGSSFPGLGPDICDNPCIGGTFALQSIDGEALPAVVSGLTDPVLVEVAAGSLTLNLDGTCSVSQTTRETMTDGTVSEVTSTDV